MREKTKPSPEFDDGVAAERSRVLAIVRPPDPTCECPFCLLRHSLLEDIEPPGGEAMRVVH